MVVVVVLIPWKRLINAHHPHNYNVLPLKYAPQSSAQFFLTKIEVHSLLFEHVMHSHFLRIHEFFTLDIQCQFVNVLLKCLK